MDGLRMLSGSQLVAKGATKRVDGQLPDVGLKDVLPNGSWLEQKQVQSALEARKHLIAVERIEKSGSLSHAEWRDDLKLAEVTKQAGSHWQYIGHRRGKNLYLLPEEALFLIETNSLLLKHNDVIVSLQKAYPLCLSDMTIVQYKVYASLSRLGYRVFRHKEPTHKLNVQNAIEETMEQSGAAMEVCLDTVLTINEQIDSECNRYDNNVDNNVEVMVNVCDNTSETVQNKLDNVKTDIPPQEVQVNDESTTTNKEISVNSETIPDKNITINVTNSTTLSHDSGIVDNKAEVNKKAIAVTADVDTNIANVSSVSDNITISSVGRIDIDDNANETVVTANNEQESVANSNVACETSNSTVIAEVYSVDQFGVIRVINGETPMETDSGDSNNASGDTNNTPESKESETDDSFKHYQVQLKHYDHKITKLTERKSSVQRIQDFSVIQDFLNKQVVKVNVPDEKYLPRNIFLHKSEYRLDMRVVRTQNASSVNKSETEQVEPAPPHSTHPHRQPTMHSYNSFNTPRYQSYQHQRMPSYHPRPYNFMFRPFSNFYGPLRYPNTPFFPRQNYMVYNVNLPGVHNMSNHHERRETIKKQHYDTIVNIALRLKNSLALPAQVQILQNLLNTFNSRYDTNVRMTPDFTIIGTTEPAQAQAVIEVEDEKVTTLSDETRRKRKRMNNDNLNYNSNVVKLKELAAKLKELHAKNLAVSRHRRVFSKAIKTFNKSFNADLHLESNFEIVDRKTVVVDMSSDSDACVVKETERPRKRKRFRNPYSILRRVQKDVNVDASTSQQVPVLRTLSLNVINDNARQNFITEGVNSTSTVENNDTENLNSFYTARFPGDDNFAGPKLYSRVNAQLDATLFQFNDVLKESLAEFESWVDIKLAILKDIRGSLNLQRQQVEALSNDFFTTESQIRPILGPDCTDLKCALKKLAIIPTKKDVPAETSLRIHFDVCNRDVHFKKSNPPKPNFRVICYVDTAPFPSTEDVVALQAKYVDGVPTVFAFVGVSASISYLQINPIDLPVYIPGNDLA